MRYFYIVFVSLFLTGCSSISLQALMQTINQQQAVLTTQTRQINRSSTPRLLPVIDFEYTKKYEVLGLLNGWTVTKHKYINDVQSFDKLWNIFDGGKAVTDNFDDIAKDYSYNNFAYIQNELLLLKGTTYKKLRHDLRGTYRNIVICRFYDINANNTEPVEKPKSNLTNYGNFGTDSITKFFQNVDIMGLIKLGISIATLINEFS